jgi:hypothetical protein
MILILGTLEFHFLYEAEGGALALTGPFPGGKAQGALCVEIKKYEALNQLGLDKFEALVARILFREKLQQPECHAAEYWTSAITTINSVVSLTAREFFFRSLSSLSTRLLLASRTRCKC